MSERRSSRARKTVNYTTDGSDDDFADNTPPPSKKSKSSKKDETSKTTTRDTLKNQLFDENKGSQNKSSETGKRKRNPLSERVFDRELQEALQLSILETGGSCDNDDDFKDSSRNKVHTNSSGTMPDVDISADKEESKIPELDKETDISDTKAASATIYAHGTTVLDESIEFLGEVNSPSNDKQNGARQTSRGRQAKRKAAIVESDEEENEGSDFNPEEDHKAGEGVDDDEDSEDDVNEDDDDDFSEEDEDSDFDDKKKKNTKKATPKIKKVASDVKSSKPSKTESKASNKKTAKVQPQNTKPSSLSTPGPRTPESITKPLSSTISSTSSSSSTSTKSAAAASAPAVHRTSQSLSRGNSHAPSWKPPSFSSPGKTSLSAVKSPQSGLRLGLSRNQRVKPLHSSARVS